VNLSARIWSVPTVKKCLARVVLTGFFLLGAGRARAAEEGGDFAQGITALLQAVVSADRVEVYEGLPRPLDEARLFAREKSAKPCRQISDQWFYAKPEAAKVALAPDLRRLIEDHLFQPWSGAKFCGGFHADYAAAFITGRRTFYVLFCFGSHEARILSENEPFSAGLKTVDVRLTTDLNDKSIAAVRELLEVYRKERPRPSSRPQAARPAARASALLARFMM
jgi:hypothetical protein